MAVELHALQDVVLGSRFQEEDLQAGETPDHDCGPCHLYQWDRNPLESENQQEGLWSPL